MATITLELPDDLAETLDALPADERNNFAVALMRDGLAYREEAEESETQEGLDLLAGPLTPEDIAAIGRGLADVDAGRVKPGPVALAGIRARLGIPSRGQ